MSPDPCSVVRTCAAGALPLFLPAAATAQDAATEIESLKKRLSEIEAKLPKDSGGDDVMNWSEFAALGSKFKLYGYLRLDAIYDDSRPNNTQVVSYIRSEDPTAPAGVRAPNNSSDYNMHPKLTRLGLDMTGPTIAGLCDAQVVGKLEIDFYNATATESREALRIRLAYAQLKWSQFNLYAGQMWDLIAPLFPVVNPDFVMWGAGNLADRRPQLRAEYIAAAGDSKLFVQGMAGATGAVDAQDLDPAGTTGAGYRDGDQAAMPTFQGRVAWRTPVADWKRDFEFGIWAHRANEETDTPVGSERNFVSSAYGIDVQVPIWRDRLWVKGELWQGRNLDDVRGGILQGINASGVEVRSEGGFGEIGWKANSVVTLHAGASFDNPENEDLNPNAGSRSRDQIAYGAIRFDFKPVLIGFDYLRWVTGYQGVDEGDDNRFQFFIQYSF